MERIPRDFRSSGFSRREAIRLLGGAGIALAGVEAFAGVVEASPVGSGRRSFALHQSPTPVPMVIPALGKQSDGSMRWHVIVGEMDMADNIEIQAFSPTRSRSTRATRSGSTSARCLDSTPLRFWPASNLRDSLCLTRPRRRSPADRRQTS